MSDRDRDARARLADVRSRLQELTSMPEPDQVKVREEIDALRAEETELIRQVDELVPEA